MGDGRLTVAIVAGCVAASVAAVPAAASVKPRDAAATHAYLKAELAERQAVARQSQAGLKAVEALAGQVKTECPGVLAGAPLNTKGQPTNESAGEIAQELLFSVFSLPEHVAHPAITRFDHAVGRLLWSSRRLTRLIHESAKEEDEQSGLPTPALCPDLKAWVQSGYTATSTATKGFLHELDRISSITLIEFEPHEEATLSVERIIAHRLKPYEDHADRVLARKLNPPKEAQELKPGSAPAERLKAFFEAANKVYAALETSPPAS
jgi:hypothetical protein